MTAEQIEVLSYFLKTQGLEITKIAPVNYEVKIYDLYNELNKLEIEKKEILEFLESDKKNLIEKNEKKAKFNEINKKIKCENYQAENEVLIEGCKKAQIEYDKSKKYYEQFKKKIFQIKSEINKIKYMQERINELKIDFGSNVKAETGIKCEMCGNLEALKRLNPYSAEIHGIKEYVTVCDDCEAILSEQI